MYTAYPCSASPFLDAVVPPQWQRDAPPRQEYPRGGNRHGQVPPPPQPPQRPGRPTGRDQVQYRPSSGPGGGRRKRNGILLGVTAVLLLFIIGLAVEGGKSGGAGNTSPTATASSCDVPNASPIIVLALKPPWETLVVTALVTDFGSMLFNTLWETAGISVRHLQRLDEPQLEHSAQQPSAD